jgi:FkbM family methyltransferase
LRLSDLFHRFDKRPIVHLRGLDVPIDPSIMSEPMIRLIRSKRYERHEARALDSIIEPGERIMELGAGIGFISALAAKNPKTAALRVYEANPALPPYIRRLHAMNALSGIEVINAVLTEGPAPATLPFHIHKHFWASSLQSAGDATIRIEHVPTLDFAAERAAFKPSMIICDIEGGEEALFSDSRFDGIDRIHLEVHPEVIGEAGIERISANLRAQGFARDAVRSHGQIVLFRRQPIQSRIVLSSPQDYPRIA